MNSLRRAFLRDIIANPQDDGVRLIYADWLEEQGETDRAEFIRVQIEQSILPDKCPLGEDIPDRCFLFPMEPCNTCELRTRLFRKEQKLREGIKDIPAENYFGKWTFRRGFIDEIRCDQQMWIDQGPIIVQNHPIQTLEVNNITSYLFPREPGFPSWTCKHNSFLPKELFMMLINWHDTQKLAEEDFNKKALFWAKQRRK